MLVVVAGWLLVVWRWLVVMVALLAARGWCWLAVTIVAGGGVCGWSRLLLLLEVLGYQVLTTKYWLPAGGAARARSLPLYSGCHTEGRTARVRR